MRTIQWMASLNEDLSRTELSEYICSKENWLQAVLDQLGWTVEGLQKVLVNRSMHLYLI